MRLVTSYQVRARPARRLKSRRDCRGRPAARSTPPRSARRNRPPGRCASVPRRSPTDNRPKSAPHVLSVIVVPHRPAVLIAKLLSTIASCPRDVLRWLSASAGAGRNLRQPAQLRSMIAGTSPTSGWTYAKNFGPPTCPNSPENMSNSTMWSSRRSRCRIRFRFGSGEKAGLPYGAPSACAASCSTCQALISITRREAGLRLRNTT